MSSIEEVAAAITEPLRRTRQELQRRLAPRPLSLTPPPGCPPDLAERVAQYNTAVEETIADLQNLESDAAGLPALVLDGDISAEEIAHRAQNIRINRLNSLRSLRWDIEHRAALADEIIQVLDAAARDADEVLEKATASVERGLRKVGVSPETTVAGRLGHNPKAAEQQFRHQIAQAEPVRAAQKVLHDLRAQRDALVGVQRGTPEDLETVQSALMGALQALVGRLC